MDYDRTDIPAAYDRSRDHGPEVLGLWMDALASHVEGQTITRVLDLGCGTGRFSNGLAARFKAQVVGLDPSSKMLGQALGKQGQGRVRYQRGRAEAIPLQSQSVDMIFMSMSFHHFDDQHLATRECRRVLRAPGKAFVRTGTRERIAAYPYVPFFPSTRALLEEVLPDCAGVREVFEAAGFRMVASEVLMQTIAPDWPGYAEKLAAGGDSVLARLSRLEFEQGLAAVRRHGTSLGPRAVVEPIDLFVFDSAPVDAGCSGD